METQFYRNFNSAWMASELDFKELWCSFATLRARMVQNRYYIFCDIHEWVLGCQPIYPTPGTAQLFTDNDSQGWLEVQHVIQTMKEV